MFTSFKEKIWPRIRGWQQEYIIENEYKYYLKKFNSLGLNPNLIKDKETAIEQFHAKVNDRLLQNNKEAHILYATPLANWEKHNLPPSISKVGQLSTYYLKEHGFYGNHRDWLVSKRAEFNRHFLDFVRSLHSRQPIDILLSYVSGWHIDADVIEEIKNLGVITTAFWLDDKLKFRARKIPGGQYEGAASLVKAYDLHLSSASTSLVKYFAEGGTAIFWPEGANEEHFTALPDLPKKYDLSFVGARYGRREEYITYLRNNGIHVATFGPGWPEGPLAAEDIPKVYAQSVINLGFGGIGYSMKETTLKGRDFELPITGAFYLTSFCEDLYKVYNIGKEIDVYKNKEELLAKVKYYLNNKDVCAQMGAQARKRCLENHTWTLRIKELVEYCKKPKD